MPKDGRFLPKSVYGLLKNKQFSKVPLITGVTDDDGGYLLINVSERFPSFKSLYCGQKHGTVHKNSVRSINIWTLRVTFIVSSKYPLT